jgi:hypothetical protein
MLNGWSTGVGCLAASRPLFHAPLSAAAPTMARPASVPLPATVTSTYAGAAVSWGNTAAQWSIALAGQTLKGAALSLLVPAGRR